MKKTSRPAKLRLHKQSIRKLTAEESRRVAGGRPGASSDDPTACVIGG
jgi:hypothetical protein